MCTVYNTKTQNLSIAIHTMLNQLKEKQRKKIKKIKLFINVYKLVFFNPGMFMQTHTPTAHCISGRDGWTPLIPPACALRYDILKSKVSTLNRSLK